MKAFARGQKSKLADLPIGDDFQVAIHLAPPGGTTVDVSCFGLDAADKLSDDRYFVFYNQKQSPEGAITAGGAANGAQETFHIALGKLPGTIKKLVFTATLDGASTMAQLQGGWLRLIAGGSTVVEFPISGGDYQAEKALIIGEIYFKDMWRFAAVGQGFNGGLSALLKNFGGEEAAGAAAPPPPAPPVPVAPPPTPAPPPPPATPPPPPVSLKKVTLEKQGQKRTISLDKGGGAVQPIHINLNWDRQAKRRFFGGGSEADLDLGCMFELADGRKGVIQALGGNFGSKTQLPFIFLDKDDRSGAASDGENLFIVRPDLMRRVMVFAFIYEGAGNFSTVNGRLTLKETDGSETLIQLNSPDPKRTFCAICLIETAKDGVHITKEERYFTGHPDADGHYKFGFSWKSGSK